MVLLIKHEYDIGQKRHNDEIHKIGIESGLIRVRVGLGIRLGLEL